MEAWGLIRETFVDPTFNHQGICTLHVGDLYLYQQPTELSYLWLAKFLSFDFFKYQLIFYWFKKISVCFIVCRLGSKIRANND